MKIICIGRNYAKHPSFTSHYPPITDCPYSTVVDATISGLMTKIIVVFASLDFNVALNEGIKAETALQKL